MNHGLHQWDKIGIWMDYSDYGLIPSGSQTWLAGKSPLIGGMLPAADLLDPSSHKQKVCQGVWHYSPQREYPVVVHILYAYIYIYIRHYMYIYIYISLCFAICQDCTPLDMNLATCVEFTSLKWSCFESVSVSLHTISFATYYTLSISQYPIFATLYSTFCFQVGLSENKVPTKLIDDDAINLVLSLWSDNYT
jgi:hypothetical protein